MMNSKMNYFGSKQWLVGTLDGVIPPECSTIMSPFFGSGVVEYSLLASRHNLKVSACDLFEPLVYLHMAICEEPDRLIETIRDEFPQDVDKEFVYSTRDSFDNGRCAGMSQLKKAATLYFMLHHSYSGKYGTFASKRGKPPIMSKVAKLMDKCHAAPALAKRLRVVERDAIKFIQSTQHDDQTIIYADPPYYFETTAFSKYYAVSDSDSYRFQRDLAAALRATKLPFIVSLNDTQETRELYSDCIVHTIPMTKNIYVHSGTKHLVPRRELLIFGPQQYWHDRLPDQFAIRGQMSEMLDLKP